MSDSVSDAADSAPPDAPSDATRARNVLPRWVKVARLVGLPLLTVWGVALLIAAWPFPEHFGRFEFVHKASRDLFATMKTRSASYVFSGRRGKWKRKFHCIMVVGTEADGTRSTLYQTYPGCQPPRLRIFEDTFDVNLKGRSGMVWNKRLVGASEKKTAAIVRELRHHRSQSGVARYFCESPQVAQPGIERIDLVWQIDQIHYDTQKLDRRLLHIHRWDCKRKRLITGGSWFQLTTDETLGPQILNPPEPQHVWRPKKRRGRRKAGGR